MLKFRGEKMDHLRTTWVKEKEDKIRNGTYNRSKTNNGAKKGNFKHCGYKMV